MNENISWNLRIEHKGFSHLGLNWHRGEILFDPICDIASSNIIILLNNTPERVRATAEAIRQGKKPIVIAAQEILDWLSSFGLFEGHSDSYEYNALKIQLTPYEGFPAWKWPESLERIQAGIRHPTKAIKKIFSKRKLPNSMPRVALIQFPSGAKLLHLNLSLHKAQQENWLKAYAAQSGECNWLIGGVDFQQTKEFSQNLSFFKSPLILVTDLLSDTRKAVGLPTQWLTPTVDELLNYFEQHKTNQMAFAFVPHASFRFHNTKLMVS